MVLFRLSGHYRLSVVSAVPVRACELASLSNTARAGLAFFTSLPSMLLLDADRKFFTPAFYIIVRRFLSELLKDLQ